jgi:hypothetical protein
MRKIIAAAALSLVVSSPAFADWYAIDFTKGACAPTPMSPTQTDAAYRSHGIAPDNKIIHPNAHPDWNVVVMDITENNQKTEIIFWPTLDGCKQFLDFEKSKGEILPGD